MWPLALLITIPGLVLLYMLRKKRTQLTVSSNILWESVFKDSYANTPWQKLKNQLLFWLQLFIIIALVLAMLNIKVPLGKKFSKNEIIVLDNSASMSALYLDKNFKLGNDEMLANKTETRLDKAKEDAIDFTKELTSANIYIISGGEILLEEGEAGAAVSTIKNIKQSYGFKNIDGDINLATSIGDSLGEEYEIVVLTDKEYDGEAFKGEIRHYANAGDNIAIINIGQNEDKVLVNVRNYSDSKFTGEVSLYDGEELLEVKEITIEPDSMQGAYFEEIKEVKNEYLKAEISGADLVAEDNTCYFAPETTSSSKVLCLFENDFFLEKALTTLGNAEIYKASMPETLTDSDVEGFDLCIIENTEIDFSKLPKGIGYLFINCKVDGIAESTKKEEVVSVTGSKSEYQYLQNINFKVANAMTYQMPYWGEALFTTNEGETVAFVGNNDGQNIAMLGFDLNSSDFAITPSFPIFIHTVMDELLKTNLTEKSSYTSGDAVEINASSFADKISLVDINGKEEAIANKMLETGERLGVFKVKAKSSSKGSQDNLLDKATNGESNPAESVDNQAGSDNGKPSEDVTSETSEKEKTSRNNVQYKTISINYPSSAASDMREDNLTTEILEQTGKGETALVSLTPAFLILALLLMLAEWFFYKKGY